MRPTQQPQKSTTAKQPQAKANSRRTKKKNRKADTLAKQNVQSAEGLEYMMSLMAPFSSPSAHIPDPDGTPSGLATSILRTTFIPATNGGISTVHSGGFIVNPYPGRALNFFNETAVGLNIFTDYNAAGVNLANVQNVPNFASLGGAAGWKARCTGIAVRLSYQGTELNRGGVFSVGLTESNQAAFGLAVSADYCQFSTLYGATTASNTVIRDSQNEQVEVRVPSDGYCEFIWKPALTPSYQTGPAYIPGGVIGTLTTPNPTTAFHSPYGGAGIQSGQNCLVVLLQGDVTTAPGAFGNIYEMEITWHWEVVPNDWSAVAYSGEPSPADCIALDRVTNALHKLPIGRMSSPSGAPTTVSPKYPLFK